MANCDLNRFLPFYEDDRCIFTHASYDPLLAMKDQPARLLRWTPITMNAPEPPYNSKTDVEG